jgi:spermidine synthase
LEAAYFVVARGREACPLTPPQHGGARDPGLGKTISMETSEMIVRSDGAGGEVVLRRRVADGRSIEELIINGTFAMDSSETSTERLLAELAVPRGNAERVLIGGLGLGYTVTAVAAKAVEVIDVVEIEQCLIDWAFQGATSTLGAAAVDPRVRMHAGDVRLVLEGTAEAPVGPWDAIVIDVDNGPDFLIHGGNRTLYTATCLRAAYGQLTGGGTLAIWCQHPAPALLAVLQGLAPSAHEHVIDTPRGERTFPYTIYTISRANHSLAKAR